MLLELKDQCLIYASKVCHKNFNLSLVRGLFTGQPQPFKGWGATINVAHATSWFCHVVDHATRSRGPESYVEPGRRPRRPNKPVHPGHPAAPRRRGRQRKSRAAHRPCAPGASAQAQPSRAQRRRAASPIRPALRTRARPATLHPTRWAGAPGPVSRARAGSSGRCCSAVSWAGAGPGGGRARATGAPARSCAYPRWPVTAMAHIVRASQTGPGRHGRSTQQSACRLGSPLPANSCRQPARRPPEQRPRPRPAPAGDGRCGRPAKRHAAARRRVRLILLLLLLVLLCRPPPRRGQLRRIPSPSPGHRRLQLPPRLAATIAVVAMLALAAGRRRVLSPPAGRCRPRHGSHSRYPRRPRRRRLSPWSAMLVALRFRAATATGQGQRSRPQPRPGAIAVAAHHLPEGGAKRRLIRRRCRLGRPCPPDTPADANCRPQRAIRAWTHLRRSSVSFGDGRRGGVLKLRGWRRERQHVAVDLECPASL